MFWTLFGINLSNLLVWHGYFCIQVATHAHKFVAHKIRAEDYLIFPIQADRKT